ncbi:hypothetical protein [Erwinia amylovora]|uniref:hypothetical protein n=1 Tax=Erwinia amylovora TaxID=552 RepID=UPI0014449A98|nr:hypothetical protein [Erwinia amylovora]
MIVSDHFIALLITPLSTGEGLISMQGSKMIFSVNEVVFSLSSSSLFSLKTESATSQNEGITLMIGEGVAERSTCASAGNINEPIPKIMAEMDRSPCTADYMPKEIKTTIFALVEAQTGVLQEQQ